VLRRDGERCRRCGTTEGLTLDHIIPLSKGGTNRIDNLQLLCGPCNRAKGNEVIA
jgi:5-methylcytosine-specific restriction endonuclease McrA